MQAWRVVKSIATDMDSDYCMMVVMMWKLKICIKTVVHMEQRLSMWCSTLMTAAPSFAVAWYVRVQQRGADWGRGEYDDDGRPLLRLA